MIFPFYTSVLTKEFNEILGIAMETPHVKKYQLEKKEVKSACLHALKITQESYMTQKFIVQFLKDNIQSVIKTLCEYGWICGDDEEIEGLVKTAFREIITLKFYNRIG